MGNDTRKPYEPPAIRELDEHEIEKIKHLLDKWRKEDEMSEAEGQS